MTVHAAGFDNRKISIKCVSCASNGLVLSRKTLVALNPGQLFAELNSRM